MLNNTQREYKLGITGEKQLAKKVNMRLCLVFGLAFLLFTVTNDSIMFIESASQDGDNWSETNFIVLMLSISSGILSILIPTALLGYCLIKIQQ